MTAHRACALTHSHPDLQAEALQQKVQRVVATTDKKIAGLE